MFLVLLVLSIYLCFFFGCLQNQESGLISMFNNHQTAQLKAMFSVFDQVPGAVDAMADCFSACYRADSEAILKKSLSNASIFMEVNLFFKLT